MAGGCFPTARGRLGDGTLPATAPSRSRASYVQCRHMSPLDPADWEPPDDEPHDWGVPGDEWAAVQEPARVGCERSGRPRAAALLAGSAIAAAVALVCWLSLSGSGHRRSSSAPSAALLRATPVRKRASVVATGEPRTGPTARRAPHPRPVPHTRGVAAPRNSFADRAVHVSRQLRTPPAAPAGARAAAAGITPEFGFER